MTAIITTVSANKANNYCTHRALETLIAYFRVVYCNRRASE